MTLYDFFVQKGIEKGREQGREEGRDEGREEGFQQALELAGCNLIEEGADDALIMRCTHLSREVIQRLRWEKV